MCGGLYTIYHQHMLLSFLSLAAASCLTHPLPSERKKNPSLRLYQAGKSITIKSSRTTTQTHSAASWLTKNCLASTLSRKHNWELKKKAGWIFFKKLWWVRTIVMYSIVKGHCCCHMVFQSPYFRLFWSKGGGSGGGGGGHDTQHIKGWHHKFQ